MNTFRTTAAAIAGLTFAFTPALAAATTVSLTATLAGANEPGGGDADGTGAFAATVDSATGRLCYTLSAAGIDKPTMAHVHAGAAGVNGPPVVTLDAIGAAKETCIAVPADKLAPILADPAQFYVNVHNAAFPAGALRGQLGKK